MFGEKIYILSVREWFIGCYCPVEDAMKLKASMRILELTPSHSKSH